MNQITVVLELDKRKDSEAVSYAEHVGVMMTNNPYFTDGAIQNQVKTVLSDAQFLRTRMSAADSKTKASEVKSAREIFDANFTILGNMVGNTANSPKVTDDKREDIVESAGMKIKAKPTHAPKTFTAECGKEPGSVILKAAGGATSHWWQATTDIEKFTNRESFEPTTTAKIEINTLQKRTDYAFFHKPIVSGEKRDWEGPVFLFVV